jgi:beta-glucanase (GH16 family)
MTDKSSWWTNEAQSYSWVKFVAAGDVLTLHYTVTSSTGDAVANALVTLNIANNSIASFSGSLTAHTNSNGLATFTLTSTTSEASAEPRPVGPSMMWYWDDSRSVSPEAKFDIVPTIGAATEHIDRVWTHTVKSASATMTKTLLWSDEFTGAANAAPSATAWNAETGNNGGWGNKELEYYTADANKQDGSSDGVLNITASRLPATTTDVCWYGINSKCSFTSGRLTTQNKVNFSYGYLEAKIKVPAGNGTWPAFWALGNNITSVSWPACGELDILEAFGRYPRVAQGTAHMAKSTGTDSYYYGQVQMPDNLSVGYHTFGILWKPTSLQWYIDDNLYFTLNKSSVGTDAWAFGPRSDGSAPKFFAILNLAMGGNLGGTIDDSLNSAVMSVDWVRYYSVDGYGAVSSS